MKCNKCNGNNLDSAEQCVECGESLGGVDPRNVTKEDLRVHTQLAGSPAKAGGAPDVPSDTVGVRGNSIDDKYKILKELGRRGMGLVYLALDTRLNREVAIKKLHSMEKGGIFGIDRFKQEAKAIAVLNHPNIVVIHELGEDGGEPFIVMEFVDGQDLGTKVDEAGALHLDEALTLMRSVCDAVSYAHRRGVIHRDIKPSNVLLTEDGIPKLVDFGLARVGSTSDLSQTGMGMGTLAYVAPEQMADAKSADHRSDIYSLGKTFYEVITGESPETVDFELVPKSVRDVFRKCLRTKPDERYSSVDDIVQDITDIRETKVKAPAYVDELGVGVCVGCGGTNDVDASFCVCCGAGLFAACPSCGQEVRTGLRFCKHCQTEIPVFLEIEEHLEAARRQMEGRRYEGVARSCRAILDIDGDHEEANQMSEIARESIKQLRVLELAMEEAIEGDDIQHAQELFQRADALTDTTTWLRQKNEMLAEAIILLDMKDARSKFKEGFYSDALLSVRQALRLGSEDAEKLLAFIDEKRKRYTADLRKASEAISAGKYEDVEQILGKYRDQPGFEAAHDLSGRAEDAIGVASKALEKGTVCLAVGAFEDGRRACDEAMRSERCRKDAGDLKLELESRKQEVDGLLRQGSEHVANRRYRDAIVVLRRVKECLPDENLPERVKAEEEIQAAEDALADFDRALDAARRKMEAGDLEGSLEECEKAAAVQSDNQHVMAIQEELNRRKIHKTALSLAEEAYRAGNFSRAIHLWQAMRNVGSDTPYIVQRLEEAQDAMQRRKIRRMGVIAVAVLACVLAVMAYSFVTRSDPLAQARSLAASGRHAEAIRVIELLRQAEGSIAGADLLETNCRFELALRGLGTVVEEKQWRDIVSLITPLRRGAYGVENRRKLGQLFDGKDLLGVAVQLREHKKLLDAACIYSVFHLVDPLGGHDRAAYQELTWLADDLIAGKRFDEAQRLAAQARELLGG